MKRISRGVVVLLFAFGAVIGSTTAADAHVLYSRQDVWQQYPNYCLVNYTELSDGHDVNHNGTGDGYTKVAAVMYSGTCGVFKHTMPIKSLKTDTDLWFADNRGVWHDWWDLGWRYNSLQADTLNMTQYWYPNALYGTPYLACPCYFFAYGAAFALVGGVWYGGWIGNDVNGKSHYLY